MKVSTDFTGFSPILFTVTTTKYYIHSCNAQKKNANKKNTNKNQTKTNFS